MNSGQDIKATLIQESVVAADGRINNNAKKMLLRRPAVLTLLEQHTRFVVGPLVETLNERIRCVMEGLTSIPLCKHCSNPTTFVGKRYQTFCSVECANKDADKILSTKRTNQQRYGGNAPMCSSDVKVKSINTCMEKYSAPTHQQSDEGRSKRRLTNVELYGAPTPFESRDIRSRAVQSLRERYGHASYNHSLLDANAKILLQDATWLKHQHIELKKPIYAIGQELNVSSFCVRTYMQMHGIQCQRFFTSKQHQDIVDMLRIIDSSLNIVVNDRSLIPPHEIDIYLPDVSIAIEVNGVYWHGELQGKGREYHLNKTTLCEEQGIKLIHVFTTEWDNHRDVVESRLRAALGYSIRKHARACRVGVVNKDDARMFFNTTHIQGHAPSSICLGLYEGDVLVAAMSFGQSRYDKRAEWEMIRYSSALGVTVVGGASRLFKNFVDTCSPSSVVSYSDVRWGTGNVYSQLGFVWVRRSLPGYYYFKRTDAVKLLHRSGFQKHMLHKRLALYDEGATEWENMQANGYDRVWDCGNDVWIWGKK